MGIYLLNIKMSATNNLRKVFGNARVGMQAVRAGCARNELTTKWLNRLRATATTNEAREVHTQLQSVLDWYNKESTGLEGTAQIDWDGFRKNIHTPNVVDRIKN